MRVAPLLLGALLPGLSGCMGMCGPTLYALDFQTLFLPAWTPENQTLAQDALRAMGYANDSAGPYGFTMRNTSATISLNLRSDENGQPNGTSLRYSEDTGHHEFSSTNQARQEADRRAPGGWARFNETLAAFEARTGWSRLGAGEFQPSIYIC